MIIKLKLNKTFLVNKTNHFNKIIKTFDQISIKHFDQISIKHF